jgi:hypothetical protein
MTALDGLAPDVRVRLIHVASIHVDIVPGFLHNAVSGPLTFESLKLGELVGDLK